MASIHRIVVKSPASNNTNKARLRLISGFAPMAMVRVASWLEGMVAAHSGRFVVTTGTAQATGTVTLSSMVATDTVTINGTVFTCVASGATGNQFNVGGTDTITATNLAAAINASATANVVKVVSATSAAAVVTVTSIVPGNVGNMCTLAISAHGSVSAANLAGGTEDASVTMYQGF